MTSSITRLTGAALAVTASLALAACSSAPAGDADTSAPVDYPTKTITMIVPYAAGGPTDIAARAIAQESEAILGQTIVVENRPGASGITGLAEVAAAAPDGYTLTFTTGNSFEQSVYRETPYTFESFEPIAGVFSQPYVLVTSPSTGVGSFADLEALDSATYATTGVGTPTHTDATQLFEQIGVDATAVPFDGSAPAVQAVVGGQTTVFFGDAAQVMPFIESGDLIPLAQFTVDGERVDYLPDVETIEELGIDAGDMSLPLWGIAAPAGTPAEIVEILRTTFLEVIQGDTFTEFADTNYFPLLTGDAEVDWYQTVQDTAAGTKAVLDKLGIVLQ